MSTTPTPPTPPPAGSTFPLREVHLLDRLAVLYRYRTAAAAMFVVAVSWIMLDSYSTTPL